MRVRKNSLGLLNDMEMEEQLEISIDIGADFLLFDLAESHWSDRDSDAGVPGVYGVGELVVGSDRYRENSICKAGDPYVATATLRCVSSKAQIALEFNVEWREIVRTRM